MRILGLCEENVNSINIFTGTGGVISGLSAALSQHHELTLADVRVKGIQLILRKIQRRLLPKEDDLYRGYIERSKIAQKITRQMADSVDIVFQIFWRYAPFVGKPLKPYVVYTDATGRVLLRSSSSTLHNSEGLRKIYEREREVYQLATKVFAYNDLVRSSVIEDYGVDPEKVIKVGVGTDLKPPPGDQIKRYDNKQMIFIGSDYAFERKGVPNLLQAFGLVKEKIGDAELILVGISKEPGIEQPGVKVRGMVCDRQRVGRLLEEASLFVMSPKQDLSPGVIREAMIKKLPCVASAVDGIPEMVIDGETGRLVPPEDPERLAEVLIELLEDEDELRRMGEQGYTRALDLYTWDKVVARINEQLHQIT